MTFSAAPDGFRTRADLRCAAAARRTPLVHPICRQIIESERLWLWHAPCLMPAMRMRVIGRQDPFLFAGLVFALVVVFQRSILDIFAAAGDVEETYGVSLRPALLILTVMFVFHQYARRREMKAEAAAAATEARLARARAEELEQLMVFGQALSRALTADSLREAVLRYLPGIAAGADAWVLRRTDGGWERLIDSGCLQWPAGVIEAVADHAVLRPIQDRDRRDGIEHDGHVCFTMIVGAGVAGVMGLPVRSHDQLVRQTIGTAAALLAIAMRNAQLFADVRDHSVKDALTGCYNRGHAVEVLEGELARSRRSGNPVSVVLFDVDHFKRINDRHGHLCGDSVLAAVGHRMRQVLRRSDVRCRYGGDEFMVVLPDTGDSGAARVAEWIRGEMEQVATTISGERIAITVSVGTATVHTGNMQPAELIDRADRALYEAKAHGRNCVRSAAVLTPSPGRAPAVEPIAALRAH
jgi:diguanylate cyclase (GGDEF)-like protein